MLPGWMCVPTAAAAGVVDLSYVGTTVSATDASSYTFTDHAIGDAASDRVVVVCVYVIRSGAMTISDLTIGGNSATSIISQQSNTAAGISAIYALAVASGTTATIVVSLSATSIRGAVSVYRLIGTGGSVTASATGADGTASDPQSASLTIPASGAGLAVAGNTAGTHTWTGATEDHDTLLETSTRISTARATVSATISVDYDSAPAFQSLAMAAWGPS